MGYHHNTLFYSYYNVRLPICIKALYHTPFLNLHGICALGLIIHQGLISKSKKQNKVGKVRERE